MTVQTTLEKMETQASLGVFGTGIDFESISQQLGMRPSHSHRAGEAGLTPRPYPQDLWLLESPLPTSETLDVHLNWLRRTLEPHYGFLRTLKKNEYEVRSYCGISVDGAKCRLDIPPDSLKIFVELGIAMDLTIIFVGDPESESPSDKAKLLSAQPLGTSVSFEVLGEPGNVSEVAKELSMLASYAHQRREPKVLTEKERAASWSLTAPLLQDDGLDAQLIWLATELSPYSSFLRSAVSKIAPLVHCVLRTERDINDQSFSPEGLSFLTSLGIPLEFNACLVAGE